MIDCDRYACGAGRLRSREERRAGAIAEPGRLQSREDFRSGTAADRLRSYDTGGLGNGSV